MKIAVIGAGSYVFGPSVLSQIFLEQKLTDTHLALVDPDLETIDLLASVGRRMARENGLLTTITTHGERSEALEGAHFVICSASPQMRQRFATDQSIIDEYLPGHLTTEFGGIAGISYSLRQIALIEAITNDMKGLCPRAWLLDVANPLPRVAQSAQENGIQTAGFCSVSLSVYGMLSEILKGRFSHYPFTEARQLWDATTAGLNHFAWLIHLSDRRTGDDLLPAIRECVLTSSEHYSNPRSIQMLKETGFLLVPGDDHTQDFLPPAHLRNQGAQAPWHGSLQDRILRLKLLHAVASDEQPWDDLLTGSAWEKPVEFISAMSYGNVASFHSLNLSNRDGQISNLPSHCFVETPCQVSYGKVTPSMISLPESVLPFCQQTAQVTDLIVQASRLHSRRLLYEAITLDPTIVDKPKGMKAIDACLTAHADILPHYGF